MRNFFKKSISILSIMTLFLSLGSLRVNAETKGILTLQEKQEITKAFRKDGLEEDTITSLIEKLDNGEQIDSMNPEKDPISKYSTTNKDGEQVEKLIYEDGSYAITTISSPNAISNRASISGGNVINGSGYKDVKGAKISHSTGTVEVYFYADYTSVAGRKSYISNVYDYKINVRLGYYTLESFGIVKKNEDLNGPAKASLNFGITRTGDLFSSSHRLVLSIDSYNSKATFY